MSAVDDKDGGPPDIPKVDIAVSEKDESPTGIPEVAVAATEKDEVPPGIPKVAVAASEKETFASDEASSERAVQNQLDLTCQDLQQARAIADNMTLADARAQLKTTVKVHKHDPNFPSRILDKINAFLEDDDVVQHPENHEARIYQMKVEAALITGNSPYAEVRAVVDNHDDPTMPCSTIRAWVIGIFFSCVLAAINQLFSIRMPTVSLTPNVIQVLAYPLGKLCERFFPDWGLTIWGIRHSLNPGPFNKKEHMLITIMANVAQNQPYTSLIIWTQYLPIFYNQAWATEFMYQILLALSTNFVGYGVAGLTRRFLVYPSIAVWPLCLVTVGVSEAFHTKDDSAVPGPFKRIYTMTRYKFFMVTFAASSVYFIFPGFLFKSLSAFSWMTWIAPDNVNLAAITGFNSGLGINPLSTFDWNVVSMLVNPLTLNFYVILNFIAGASVAAIAVIAMWYTNTLWTAHIPIYTNRTFDNTGKLYNIKRAINDTTGLFDGDKYKSYSPPFISAGSLVLYFSYFAQYPAAIMYIILNHGHEMLLGLESFYSSLLPIFRKDAAKHQYHDIHNRLMAKYAEVPGLWYMIVLLLSVACGLVAITTWDKNTNPAVVFFGLGICTVFVLPIGIIRSVTGVEVTLNVFAEFLGGFWYEGDALSMNFLKSYGFVTCSHAVQFASDLKLAHYVKIPPRQTFAAQICATLVSTLICTGMLNFQMRIPDVCTDNAPFNMFCPNVDNFFMASILWGTIGPRKLFGTDGQYRFIQLGWAVGFIVPLLFWGAKRLFPSQKWLRMASPILMFYAPTMLPYNLSYMIPAVPFGYASWVWIRGRYLAFWSRYNYVTSAALTTGVTLTSVVLFFAFALKKIEVNWWGNDTFGCENLQKNVCVRLPVMNGTTFGPTNFH